MVEKIPVAVMGATGLVGQRFVQLLADHPWFEIVALTASDRSAGKPYREAVHWVLGGDIPGQVADLRVEKTRPWTVEDAMIVFVALPSSVAPTVEPALAETGKIVVSNASSMRLEQDVPLINPEVNPDHLVLVEEQRKRRGWQGAILKVPNCSTAILTLTVKPIDDKYRIREIHAVTMQAVSGAGYNGIPSYQILDNIVPYIPREEEKIRSETRKILGKPGRTGITPHPARIHATTTRAPVTDGHLEVLHIKLEEPPATLKETIKTLENYTGKPQQLQLPTAPPKPIIVAKENNRPQPRLDRMNGNGMSVTTGRIRLQGDTLQLVTLGHNTIRGAAGTGILIAELYLKTTGQK